MPYKSKVKRRDSLPVREFYDTFKDELKLDLIAGAKGLDNIIGERSVNRPALALVGHFQFFANKRIASAPLLFLEPRTAFIPDHP